MLFADRCLRVIVCCGLLYVCCECSFVVVRCLLFVVYCGSLLVVFFLFVVCWLLLLIVLLFVNIHGLLAVVCFRMWFAVCGLMCVVVVSCCVLGIVWRLRFVACCL